MTIPSENIGSIPRPASLVQALLQHDPAQEFSDALKAQFDQAVRDTVLQLEATGSLVVSDGEQRKTSGFATYALQGLKNLAPDGFLIPFQDGHTRQLPRLTTGPFRFGCYASDYVKFVCACTQRAVKQAVISPSALSLIYPKEELSDYSRDQFIEDLIQEQEKDIRQCFANGASTVQIDFTEGRLSVKLDPSGAILQSFVDINNMVLGRFSAEERSHIGVHTCPGADKDSTHSADIDYADLLPTLFELRAGIFYIALAAEKDPEQVLRLVAQYSKPEQRIFVGVIDVNNPEVETPEQVRDRVLLAAKYIPLSRLGTTDDCGFSPFYDDQGTSRATAFAKIRARIEGTRMASEILAGRGPAADVHRDRLA